MTDNNTDNVINDMQHTVNRTAPHCIKSSESKSEEKLIYSLLVELLTTMKAIEARLGELNEILIINNNHA